MNSQGKTESHIQLGLKTTLRQGISEPEFYGDLVYKFKKVTGRTGVFF